VITDPIWKRPCNNLYTCISSFFSFYLPGENKLGNMNYSEWKDTRFKNLFGFQSFDIEHLMKFIPEMCCVLKSWFRRVCKHSFTEIHKVNLRTLTERHVITFRKQLINLLYQLVWTILVKLGEINMTPLIILNKTQEFYYRVKF
jgi:hypothetical protein